MYSPPPTYILFSPSVINLGTDILIYSEEDYGENNASTPNSDKNDLTLHNNINNYSKIKNSDSKGKTEKSRFCVTIVCSHELGLRFVCPDNGKCFSY